MAGLSIRTRLSAACVGIVLLPLVLAAGLTAVALPQAQFAHSLERLLAARDAAAAAFAGQAGLPDAAGLRAAASREHAGLTLVTGGGVAASSLPPAAAAAAVRASPLGSAFGARPRDSSVLTRVVPLTGAGALAAGPLPAIVVSTPRPDPAPLIGVIAAVLVLLAGAAAAAGLLLARRLTGPLGRLNSAAERLAQGDLDVRLPVEGQDEIGRLAAAFNAMATELSGSVIALRAGEDALRLRQEELRRNLNLLGDTLSSTHDLSKILDVILDTALTSVSATAGAVLLTSADGTELCPSATRGLAGRWDTAPGAEPRRIHVGRGLTGRVAATGEPVLTNAPGAALAPDEPRADAVLSVPLRSAGRVTGVLSLYDPVHGAFVPPDLDLMITFAGQAAVAIDNVLLHQEAQRLSVTDGLTGLWNYRYLTNALAREVERAARFARPLSLLMLDLDRFKRVNDVYGHQRGDLVLVELASRVRALVREVDVVARYGGEEVVLVLPETDLDGARLLAERVRLAVRSTPFTMGAASTPLLVTTSVGVAVYPSHGRSAVELLRAADTALYLAKAAGRDCWRAATPTVSAPVG